MYTNIPITSFSTGEVVTVKPLVIKTRPQVALTANVETAPSTSTHPRSIHEVRTGLEQQRLKQVDISSYTTARNIRRIYRDANRARGKIKDQNYPVLVAQHCNVKLTQKLLPLSAEAKFTPRKTGLKAALHNFETRLQETEPSLYAACKHAANQLSPLEKIPDMVYCIAAHQSEEHLTNLIDLISKQSIAKQQKLALFIFLNGDEPKAKIAELNNKLAEHPNLDFRLITAKIAKGNGIWVLKASVLTPLY